MRVHEVSGSPRPSFEVMCGSMGFRGFRDPQSNLFIGPNGFMVPWDLVQIYVQVHEISGSPGTSFKLICRPNEVSGSPRTSFTFIFSTSVFGARIASFPTRRTPKRSHQRKHLDCLHGFAKKQKKLCFR